MRRTAAGLLLAAISLGIAGCPAPPQKIASTPAPTPTPTPTPMPTPTPTPSPTVQGIAIASTSVTLNVPYTSQDVGLAPPAYPLSANLGGTLSWSNGSTTSAGITWTSSNPALVSVDATGDVKAVVADLAGVGHVVVTAAAAADPALVATASVASVFPAWGQGIHVGVGSYGGTPSVTIPFAPYTGGSLTGTGSL